MPTGELTSPTQEATGWAGGLCDSNPAAQWVDIVFDDIV